MSEFDFDIIEDDKEQMVKNQADEGQAWLTSYSDIVTLLLCFFILFYYLEKNIEKGQEESMLHIYRNIEKSIVLIMKNIRNTFL